MIKQFVRKGLEWALNKERWFQSEKYFKDISDIIRNDFTLVAQFGEKAHFIHRQIASVVNPISLHIRRGDYVTDPATTLHHGVLPVEYYKEAVLRIEKTIPNPIFFVFSDDINWAKENLTMPYQFIFVSDPLIPDYEEIILMSKCHHHIIANSSFSWWGAWLNPRADKVVIAPKQWTTDPESHKDITPANWLRL